MYPPDASCGYFGLAFATPLPYEDRFLKLTVSAEKLDQLVSPDLQDILIVTFSVTEISVILKNKIAALGITSKIIYLFCWLVLVTITLNLFIGDRHNRYIYVLYKHTDI